jgi:hypothetical protein
VVLELGGNSMPFVYAPQRPIQIIYPGYSVMLACDRAGVGMSLSLGWLVLASG